MSNSVDPDQTAPGSTLLASMLNSSVMLGNYLQKTTSADDICRCISFLGALRVKRTLLKYREPTTFENLDSISLCLFIKINGTGTNSQKLNRLHVAQRQLL